TPTRYCSHRESDLTVAHRPLAKKSCGEFTARLDAFSGVQLKQQKKTSSRRTFWSRATGAARGVNCAAPLLSERNSAAAPLTFALLARSEKPDCPETLPLIASNPPRGRVAYSTKELPMDPSFWTNILHPDISVLEKIVRPIIVYFSLVVLLRLAGKRELAQLNNFDLIVLLTLSNTVQNAIIGSDNSVAGGLIGATSLVMVNYVVVRFFYKHQKLDRLVEGSEDLLIANGKIIRH